MLYWQGHTWSWLCTWPYMCTHACTHAIHTHTYTKLVCSEFLMSSWVQIYFFTRLRSISAKYIWHGWIFNELSEQFCPYVSLKCHVKHTWFTMASHEFLFCSIACKIIIEKQKETIKWFLKSSLFSRKLNEYRSGKKYITK